ncbi:MAG TPA: phosphodiesterase, partial [Candidatus Dormibacteraeota bacterium]|nr:phosphodiesterase [Candidatus Dormibacteraeota bacterium]
VYTGGYGKISEHGGADPQDRNVPILVTGAGVGEHLVNNSSVETTQIAPTILKLLGLNPNALKAVEIEHTAALPISG